MEHNFTPVIFEILKRDFGTIWETIYKNSPLLQYLNIKTKSASEGSKARAAFGNHYALYVLIEDYISKGFYESGNYKEYEGARFTDLLLRQRQLPFGEKLQNHALNHRLNQEFQKYFPTAEVVPVIRDTETRSYWINEALLLVDSNGEPVNIAPTVINIIEAYITIKKESFDIFIRDCERIIELARSSKDVALGFIEGLLRPETDARIFEITSFAILKAHFGGDTVFWGFERDDLTEEQVVLYKTGRTNANDGGIDFVMRPLGRFFQVTESLDVRKYFLDIDKVHRFPLTFVVKSNASEEDIKGKIQEQASAMYTVSKVVSRYMDCIEQIINIPALISMLHLTFQAGKFEEIIKEIITQSKVEFNYPVI